MNDVMEKITKDAICEYSQILENFISESVFNYANPKLKIKGKVTKESIGKKLQWRGIKCINCNIVERKTLMFIVQRNIIISGFMVVYFPEIFKTDIFHPFFGKNWNENFLNIKDYLGMAR